MILSFSSRELEGEDGTPKHQGSVQAGPWDHVGPDFSSFSQFTHVSLNLFSHFLSPQVAT